MSRHEIITCDGCGMEDYPLVDGFRALKPRFVFLSHENVMRRPEATISADLCAACRITFELRWDALDPKNWPKGLEEQAVAAEAHQKDAASRQARFLATAEARRGFPIEKADLRPGALQPPQHREDEPLRAGDVVECINDESGGMLCAGERYTIALIVDELIHVQEVPGSFLPYRFKRVAPAVPEGVIHA